MAINKDRVDFLQVLKQKKKQIWPRIKIYLAKLDDYPDYCRVSDKYQDLVEFHKQIASEYSIRKGKYFRSSLILILAHSMGYPEQKAVQTAAAMEICQSWILNHDDIEDDSRQRRGKPCLHKMVSPELAINAGDTLHILMWKVLKDNLEVIGMDAGLRIIEEFYRILNRTTLGQTVEIKWTQENNLKLSIEDILFILESKTGYYTMAGPMRLGAILAGATENQLNKLYKFGKLLGYAFQIKDDLLDLTSDFKGKKNQQGNDIYEGKRTIMLVHLLENISSDDKTELIKILRKSRDQKTAQEVNWVIGQMEEAGSLNFCRELIDKYLAQADEYLENKIDFINQEGHEQLKAFIKLQKTRKY